MFTILEGPTGPEKVYIFCGRIRRRDLRRLRGKATRWLEVANPLTAALGLTSDFDKQRGTCHLCRRKVGHEVTPLMPRGPRGEKRPADVIGNAVKVMRIATGEETEILEPIASRAQLPSWARGAGKARSSDDA